jgi:BirA family biotin operon repressor/biotin-[acetyl-CoA-carboxylase] ligase
MRIQQPAFVKLVKLLNDGNYHDGTTLGNALNITRSAVWKMRQKLETYDIKIDSIKGKGYALTHPLILLDKKNIKTLLEDKNIDIHIFETIPTTNDFKNFPLKKRTPAICLAEQQTQGKGRLGRHWHSPFAQNLYFTCLYTFQKDISELAGLSLAVGLAIIETLKIYAFPDSVSIKWPNDIIYQQCKLAGTLIEIKAEAHNICQTLIGIGINVNIKQEENKLISQPFISLKHILNQYIDRNHLCAVLINMLLRYLKKFEQEGLSPFIKEWKNVDALFNKKVTLVANNQKIEGIAKGINAQGQLLLELAHHKIQAFSSGDTTIAKT